MKRELIALFLAVIMVIGLVPVTVFAEGQFTDMPENWSTEALESAVENGLLQGSNEKIMPNDHLTRAQMATIINRSFGSSVAASLEGYSDVAQDSWYYNEMSKAVQMKTFQGSGGKLNPDNQITREEAFAVLSRAFKLGSSNTAPAGFNDLGEISDWAKGEVYSLIKAGYIQGSNGLINPKNKITRAEFAQVMYNIVKTYANQPGEYTSLPEGNVMINVADVTLKDVNLDGDLIIGDGVGDGNVTLDNVQIAGRLVVRGGGTESIIIKGNSNIGRLIIAKVDGSVRVFTEDGTIVETIEVVDGKNEVIIEGNLEELVVRSETPVLLINADVKNVVVEAGNSTLTVDEGSKVESVVVKGAATTIEGKGTVEEVIVESTSEDTKITTPNTEIIVEKGAKAVTGTGGVAIPDGAKAQNADAANKKATVEEKKVEQPKSSGGGGGGGGGGSPTPKEAKATFLSSLGKKLNNISDDKVIAKLDGENIRVTFDKENTLPSEVLKTAEGIVTAFKSNLVEGTLNENFPLTPETTATEVARYLLGGDEKVANFLSEGGSVKADYTAKIKENNVEFDLSGSIKFINK